MQDFILVVPEGWIPIDLPAFTLTPGVSVPGIQNWIASNQLPYLADALVEAGMLTPDTSIYAAKMFDDTNLVIMLG